LQDIRYGARTLTRTPAFTVTAVLTLALGIGANTAMFSAVNSVLLKPLAYPDSDRLYVVRTVAPSLAALGPDLPVNIRHFQEWRSHCAPCADVALAGGQGFTLTGSGEPERLPGLQVSSNFLHTLGVRPAIGRDFARDQEGPGRARVVLLSDALWRRRFGADPTVLGRAILLNGQPTEVIGVLPSEMRLPKGSQWGSFFAHNLPPALIVPVSIDPMAVGRVGDFNFAAIVRLAPDASAERARAALDSLISDFSRETSFDMRTKLIPLADQMTTGARDVLWMLSAAVAAVLLIVCVNVGNLMLVRSTGRAREAGIRLALGASRSDLFRLVLGESALLVVAGASLGVLAAYAGVQIFRAAAPIDLPRLEEVAIDWRVLGFAGTLCAISVLLCGLLPAWRLAATEPASQLAGSRAATESRSRLRFLETMVGVEVALGTALLIVAGLLTASFAALMRVDRGFQLEQVVTQNVSLAGMVRYASAEARHDYIERAIERLDRMPGVRAAGAASHLPLLGETWIDALVPSDWTVEALQAPFANYRFVSPGYWTAMGIPLKAGRYLESRDRGKQVAVLGERAATQLWPGESPIGKRIRRGENRPLLEVVGVAGDVRAGLDREAPLTVYEPYWMGGPAATSFVVRTAAEPAVAMGQIREALAEVDPELALSETRTMAQIQAASVATRRFQTLLAAAFAVAALVLAALGLYGVISFSVARRTREMGLRIALGARAGQITAMILRQGLTPVLLGLAAGAAGALTIGDLLAGLLYGVTSRDPLTFAGVTSVFLLVSAAACLIPARRATRVDPMFTLRAE
jgi:putative ABC transport system permease protein